MKDKQLVSMVIVAFLLNLIGLGIFLYVNTLAKYRPLIETWPPASLHQKPSYLYDVPSQSGDKLGQPLAVAAGKRGLLYITVLDNPSVQVFYPNGERAFSFGHRGQGEGRFNYPYGIGVKPDGNVVVSDALNGTLQEFTARGRYVDTLFKGGRELRPGLVVVDQTGKVYASELNKGQILVIDADGKMDLIAEQDLSFPQGLIIENDKLWVADSGNNLVKVISMDRQRIREFSPSGTGYTAVRGLARDNLARVYVADALTGRISVFDRHGQPLFAFGGMGKNTGKFAFPTGLAVHGGAIFVADRGNNRVQVWGYSRE